MGAKENIRTLNIAKSYTCPNCKTRNYRTDEQRRNIAQCIMANSNGLWSLEHCGNCGYVVKTYPTRINGVECTKEECEKLADEIKRYDKNKKTGKV